MNLTPGENPGVGSEEDDEKNLVVDEENLVEVKMVEKKRIQELVKQILHAFLAREKCWLAEFLFIFAMIVVHMSFKAIIGKKTNPLRIQLF